MVKYPGEIDITENIPDLHAWLNSPSYLEEVNFHQNARHAFPNRIPKRGRGKTKKQKKAVLKAKILFRKRAKYGPLGLPLAIPNSSRVSRVMEFLIKTKV